MIADEGHINIGIVLDEVIENGQNIEIVENGQTAVEHQIVVDHSPHGVSSTSVQNFREEIGCKEQPKTYHFIILSNTNAY